MPDNPDRAEHSGSNTSADADARLHEFIRTRQTPERLQEDWDRLRGAHRMRGSGDAGRVNVWEEFKAALWLARVPQKVAWAAAVVAALGVAWFALMPGTIRLRAPDGFQVAGISLPDQLRFRPGGQSARLTGGAAPLSGRLGSLRSGTAGDVAVYDLQFEGVTTNGLPVVFSGRLIVTNAPGVERARRQSQVLGALLDGDIKIGDRVFEDFKVEFIP